MRRWCAADASGGAPPGGAPFGLPQRLNMHDCLRTPEREVGRRVSVSGSLPVGRSREIGRLGRERAASGREARGPAGAWPSGAAAMGEKKMRRAVKARRDGRAEAMYLE